MRKAEVESINRNDLFEHQLASGMQMAVFFKLCVYV